MPKPQLPSPIPMRVPVDVLADIEAIANACDRSRSWVMVRAMKLYLAGEGSHILSVVRGREEAATGGGHAIEDVIAELDNIIGSGSKDLQ